MLLPACATFGLSFISLSNSQKQHRYIDGILLICGMAGVGGAVLLSQNIASLPVWLCRIVPGALLLGQVVSLIVGTLMVEPDLAVRLRNQTHEDEKH